MYIYTSINILRINCAPSWFYLQNYTEMHRQQNIKQMSTTLHTTPGEGAYCTC